MHPALRASLLFSSVARAPVLVTPISSFIERTLSIRMLLARSFPQRPLIHDVHMHFMPMCPPVIALVMRLPMLRNVYPSISCSSRLCRQRRRQRLCGLRMWTCGRVRDVSASVSCYRGGTDMDDVPTTFSLPPPQHLLKRTSQIWILCAHSSLPL
ncbi:hypothetical protein B0H14DRAFT_2888096 [Mycena olivaceomarginata]|nr:hypothetical protein B0H14DRAFT_2888096 [Mycena olivaceomarginata]